jgi:secondary thiamine-phosphate synthase enzyme
MNWFKDTLEVNTRGKRLYDFTDAVQECVRRWGMQEGMCFLYVQHTSASLVVSESYDPSAKADLEEFMNRQVPENQPWHNHTLEGPDDSPSHIRAMLTLTSLTIPVDEGRLNLGTWQGIYLFEHRVQPHRRKILVRGMDVSG